MTETNGLALVTGASTGIGAEIARELARRGRRLALVARDRAKLDALAGELGAPGGAPPLVIALDLLAPGAVGAMQAAVAAAGGSVDLLVNNAGIGLQGPAAELDPDAQLAIVDLNCRVYTEVALRFLPDIRRARGKMLNVASSAAYLPGPGMTVYYASKAYALSFSEGLATELKRDGVTVTALCPGPVPTAFQARARMSVKFPAMAAMSAQAVAKAGVDGLFAGKRVVIPGLPTKGMVAMSKVTPRAWGAAALATLQFRPFKRLP